MWAFFLLFWKVACDDGAIWYYCTLCHFVDPITQQEMMKGVIKYTKKNVSIIQDHFLCVHANKFTSFLEFLELRNTSQPNDVYELSMDDSSRKHKNADKVSVGGRLLDYLLPYHPYGDNHPKQREFEVNGVAFMLHVFTSLPLVDHDCFRKLTQHLGPRLHPSGRSKMSRSIIPTENQLVDKYVIERLEKVKAVVIS